MSQTSSGYFQMFISAYEYIESAYDSLWHYVNSSQLCFGHSCFELNMHIMITVIIASITVVLFLYYLWVKFAKKDKVLPQIVNTGRPRFRKRDKVLFYGRKMIRRVKSIAKPNGSKTKLLIKRKKMEVIKMAKTLLRLKKENLPTRRLPEPPSSFFEPDMNDFDFEEHKLPAEVLYMLKSIRVLGHFEKPIFLELCRYMESMYIRSGQNLFRVGDSDDSIYVVQSGRINVYIADTDGSQHLVKVVQKGDSIHSLLSIMDVLTGHLGKFKTVSAKAATDTTVLRLPVTSIQTVLDRFPESQVRVVQMIMVRLQRVTFTALYNYLGLSYELMKPAFPASDLDPTLSVHHIALSAKGSPVRRTKPVEELTNSAHTPEDDEVDDAGSTKKKSLIFAENTKQGHHSDTEPTDFDVACSRARVGFSLDDDPFLTGSPPSKHVVDDSLPHSYAGYTTSRKAKRSMTSGRQAPVSDSGMGHTADVELDDEEIMDIAVGDIAKIMDLQGTSLLTNKCFLQHFRSGVTITRQGDQDASLYFLVLGELCVSQAVVGQKNEAILYRVYPGEMVGALAVLTGEPSFFRIRAKKESVVVVISKKDFYSLMREQPKIVLNVGHTIVRRMSPFVRQIDFALDWQMIEAGRSLFKQGEASDCVYIVLSGRLRSVVTQASGKKELVAEYGRGELVGIVESLTQTERASTMIAIRDSELAVIPDLLLNLIKRRYPHIVTRLIHLMGERILGSLRSKAPTTGLSATVADPRSATANLSTVAVVAISEDIPLTNFTMELQHNLNTIGPTLRLTSDIILNRLGNRALEHVNEYRLSSWLGQQEDVHRMVLYQCDFRMTPWTQRCIRQADCILIIGLADKEPTVGKIEQAMEHIAVRAQKEFILLHKEDGDKPRNTVEWLNQRGYCSSHHHIRCPKRVFSKKTKARMADIYRDLFDTQPDKMSDFARLARFLTGTSVGLVLGGGGARGVAHIGIIRSMLECGIPIDMVGGTSIGSFMGALWADERNIVRFTQRAREWSMEFKKTWKKVLDLTYPVTAMFSGRAFNQSIQSTFKDRQIEDLWIPYFCITTDISVSKMRVHTIGSVWRYVRASMSLSGYLPPLCDPTDGHLLLDGGYVNNLPANIMRSMGAQTVFAIDVGADDSTDYDNFGDELSGWWLAFNKWNPWGKTIKIPNMQEVQSKLAYVSCVRLLEEIKGLDYVEYIRPPIARYGTLQFHLFDEILDVGYHHGQSLFSTWVKSGLVKNIFKERGKTQSKHLEKPTLPAEADFTDLAELISRIDETVPYDEYVDDSNEEEEDDDELSTYSDPGIIGNSVLYKPKLMRAASEGGSPNESVSSVFADEFHTTADDALADDEDATDEDIPQPSTSY